MTDATDNVLLDVAKERIRQDAKLGQQDHEPCERTVPERSRTMGDWRRYAKDAEQYTTHEDPLVKKLAFTTLMLKREIEDNETALLLIEQILRKAPGYADMLFNSLNSALSVVKLKLQIPF